jgi:cell division protease FtsH
MVRNIVIALLVMVGVTAMLFASSDSGGANPAIGFGEVIQDAQAGRIDTIEVDGHKLAVRYIVPEGSKPVTKESEAGENTDVAKFLSDAGIALTRSDAQPGQPAVNLIFKASGTSLWMTLFSVFITLAPFVFIGLFLWFILRRAGGAGSEALRFGKSRARLFAGNKVSVTFDDVAGVDEAKEELREVVEFLEHPEKFLALGARIPKGVLLVGPPGTGKTLIARAVAGEAGVPFFSISASEFVEMFVGVGASRVRDLFDQAKKNAPCIVFLDEIDAVGRQRGAGLGGGNDEREQTLNQVLVEMDGFEVDTNVIVLAATNRPDILDPALLRPGRFDRKVILDPPDVKGREAILRVHTRGKPLAPDVSLPVLAKTTPGFTGADLANLVNEAAMLAARRDRTTISMEEFGEAVDRVVAGPERKSRVFTPRERRLMAYHEGGHTVVAHFMEHHDPPHKVTIVAHGLTGGYTRFLPKEEQHFRTPSMFRDELCTALGGHAAEQLVFGEASTGPSNDIEEVTQLARSMVTRWGMSERLGPRTFGRSEELVFLGRQISETRNYSEKFAEEIDEEVQRLIDEARQRALAVLTEHRALLDKLVTALLEVETLEGDELQGVLDSDPAIPWIPPRASETGPEPPAPAGPPQPAPQGLRWEAILLDTGEARDDPLAGTEPDPSTRQS